MTDIITIDEQQRQTMSQLLFKTMANAYCRYKQQNHFFQDCISAIDARIGSLKNKLSMEINQMKEVFSDGFQNGEMSVIEEEESDRSFSDEGYGFQQWMDMIKKKCNNGAHKLQNMEEQLQKLVNVYKGELLEMSKQMTNWEDKNQELKKNIKIFTTENQKLKMEIQDLKDQITNQAANFVLTENIDCEEIFAQPKFKAPTSKNKSEPKIGVRQKLTQMGEQANKTKNTGSRRASIKRTHIEPQNLNKENSRKVENQLVKEEKDKEREKERERERERQKLKQKGEQKQREADNMKWKKLSKKIEQLKAKLSIYEQEISEKNTQIQALHKKIKESHAQDEQKRKLKTSNTTLRGEKTVLNNQLSSLKKNFAQKVEICDLQQMQIRQLKAQIDNFTTTIKWQSETIDQLRATLTKGMEKESESCKQKIEKLEKMNGTLVRNLVCQQEQLQQFNKKLVQIEMNYQKGSQKYCDKIAQLESILDQKNQIIVKLKTKGNGGQSQNAYFSELVKVLNKKLAEKQQVLRRLTTTH